MNNILFGILPQYLSQVLLVEGFGTLFLFTKMLSLEFVVGQAHFGFQAVKPYSFAKGIGFVVFFEVDFVFVVPTELFGKVAAYGLFTD